MTATTVPVDGVCGLVKSTAGNGRFSNATTKAGFPPFTSRPASAAFVDFDHDGDLDVVVGGDAQLQLVRNNGNGTFTDITAQSGIAGQTGGVAIVPTDYDNHRDIDLLIVKAAVVLSARRVEQRTGVEVGACAPCEEDQGRGGVVLELLEDDPKRQRFKRAVGTP